MVQPMEERGGDTRGKVREGPGAEGPFLELLDTTSKRTTSLGQREDGTLAFPKLALLVM